MASAAPAHTKCGVTVRIPSGIGFTCDFVIVMAPSRVGFRAGLSRWARPALTYLVERGARNRQPGTLYVKWTGAALPAAHAISSDYAPSYGVFVRDAAGACMSSD